MSNNSRIIVDQQAVENTWLLIENTEDMATKTAENVLLPMEAYLEQSPQETIGVWLNNTVELNEELAEKLKTAPVIAINFPAFMDGRGFSIARLLRTRFGYSGEIRAVGHIIRDQLSYLSRCGFNAFCLQDDVDVEAALNSLKDFSESYQTSADQSTPLFRRRA